MTPRQRLVLAALSAGKSDASLSPVQAQKLFFLIDENVADALGGKLFNFEPYDYGPFDGAVYSELDWLSGYSGHVEINRNGSHRTYRLTELGRQLGQARLAELHPEMRNYFERAKDWVTSLSFQDLVRAIYQAYPAMRAKSIFRG